MNRETDALAPKTIEPITYPQHEIVNVGETNLEEYPTEILNTYGEEALTIGDLHGNALKCIWILIKQGIMQLKPLETGNTPKDTFGKIVEIYKKDAEALTKEDIETFNRILWEADFTQPRALRLIGDELADRGNNDYFMLKILERLGQEDINTEILLSNHSVEFLQNYKQLGADVLKESKESLGDKLARSLYGFNTLVRRGIITKEESERVTNTHYLHNLKAISYSIDYSSEQPTFTFYTHAPVGLETVQMAAQYYGVPYDDSTPSNLAESIDQINVAFQKDLMTNMSFLDDFDSYDYYLGYSAVPHQQPLLRLMWNRSDVDQKWAETHSEPGANFGINLELKSQPPAFNIVAVHGHDGPIPPNPAERNLEDPSRSILPNMINTDNNNGKGSLGGPLHFVVSSDMPALRLEFLPPSEPEDYEASNVFHKIQEIYTAYKKNIRQTAIKRQKAVYFDEEHLPKDQQPLRPKSANEHAFDALQKIKTLIEKTEWQLGIWGSRYKILVNGQEKMVPFHIKKIYNEAQKADRNPKKAVETLQSIHKIAHKAQTTPTTWYNFFGKRSASTQSAYEEISKQSDKLFKKPKP